MSEWTVFFICLFGWLSIAEIAVAIKTIYGKEEKETPND